MAGIKKPATWMGATSMEHCIQWFDKECFASFTQAGECVTVSSNWQNISGYPIKASIGAEFLKHVRKVDIRNFLELLESQEENKTVRVRYKHKNGHWEWLECSNATLLKDGNVGVIFYKVTDMVSKEHALQKATIETELAMQGQSEFFAHISHELRTPLNAIIGFTQMMHQGMFGEVANPRYRDYIQFMEQSGQELLAKIDDLLEVSSLCAGIEKLTERTLPLRDIVTNVINTHARDLFARQIRIDVDINNVSVIADRIKLQQALSHLVRNAVKFSPKGSVIQLYSKRNKGGDLLLSLADQGNGFSEAQLLCFSGVPRESAFLQKNQRVMGFGLPLAEELIRLHGGKLMCHNAAANKGAIVTLSLPKKRIIGVLAEKGHAVEKRYKTHAAHDEMAL